MTTPTPTQQAEALWIRAHEHVRRGDFANAVRDLAACFKILQQLGDPRLPEVHRRWTEVHQLALEDAAHQKQAAAPKVEAQRPTLEAEAEAAANTGDLEKAIALLERAAAERPDNELVRERLMELKNARARARELGANVAAEPVAGVIAAEDVVAGVIVQEAVVEAAVVEAAVVEENVIVEASFAAEAAKPTVRSESHEEQDEDEAHEPVERTAILYAFEPAVAVEVAPASPGVDVPVETVAIEPAIETVAIEPAIETVAIEAAIELAIEPASEPVAVEPAIVAVEPAVERDGEFSDGIDLGVGTAIDVDLTSGPVVVAPGPDADIHTVATLVPTAAVELEVAVGNAETDFGDIDVGDQGPSLTVEPMIEASVVPVAPIDDESPFSAAVTDGPLNPAAASDITSSLELATRADDEFAAALDPAPAIGLDDTAAPALEVGDGSSATGSHEGPADAPSGSDDTDLPLELSTETKEVEVGGPTATFAVEQELQAGPSIELAVELPVETPVEMSVEPTSVETLEPTSVVEAATEAPLMAAEDAPVGMPSLDVQIDMGAMVSADEADELPVSADELEVVGDDMSVEEIVSLPPQPAAVDVVVSAGASVEASSDALPDDPVALLETLLGRIAANRRAA